MDWVAQSNRPRAGAGKWRSRFDGKHSSFKL